MTTDADATTDVLQRRFYVAGSCMAALLHVGLAVFFYVVDQPAIAHWDVAAVCVHLIGAAFAWRGRLLLGTWIVLGSGLIHTAAFLVILGPESGFGYYFVAGGAAAAVFLRPWPRHMAAVALFAIGLAAAVIANSRASRPWIVLEDTVIDVLHAGNLLASTATIVITVFLMIEMNRRKQRELARLRQEVKEARQLGQYTLGEKLGEGGMGQVYRATHALLRRPAAIKLLREGEVNEAAMRRFEAEVQLTSELSDPNTIAIYDYGRTPEGVFYYVMEYLEGLSLDTLVDHYGPQPPERVVHILEQVCESLEEAHARGLVHRDIKPANIILCERGAKTDAVKVLDFGLVKDLSADDAAAENVVAGTPAYLSPEAIADPDTVGPLSDLYAVGAVGYFLLTGQEVFERKTLAALLAAHLLDEPLPLRERLGTPVPEALQKLVLDCLDKDPANRPQSAHALRQALGAVELLHRWTEGEARTWWTNHRQNEPPVGVAAAATEQLPSGVRGLTVQVDVRGRKG
jgi:predicted Ser/Thr protein kinase